MKKKLLLVALSILAVNSATMAYVYISDGEVHTFDHNTYQDDYVILDDNVANNPGTHVDIVAGGSVWLLHEQQVFLLDNIQSSP